uniref:NADH-ubiquinone oxidoreductase chain 2 n=1 Tax=Uleiota sp. BMNH 833935 TaxID=1903802 RepID=A0A343A453_9CUCU|nr:NADH dehydrogenase subunit 2 [Uleiota sp. BMNH 833935]
MFFNIMIMGSMISISSYSWLNMWIGLEINLMAIIPLMSSIKNIYASEASMKYFITQALASTILLFSLILMNNKSNFFPYFNNYMIMMLNSSLLTKMGAAPFHFWFPEVMNGLNWNNCMILLTWQKLAPMILFMYNINMTMFNSIIIIMSSTMGSLMGLNQTSLRKIIAYSSINHISWMIASMLYSQYIWLIYFITYSIITINIIIFFKISNNYNLTQLINSFNKNKMIKLTLMMNFLSLGGLPPFIGFLPKWLTINLLIYNNHFMISLILILMSLITLFFYLRLSFSSLMIYSNESLKLINFQFKYFFMYSNILNLSSLIYCSFMFNFM